MTDIKKIPASKVRQFYKRFTNGEQYIELGPISPITNDFEEVSKRYWWQDNRVYNMVKPLIMVYGTNLTEDQLYGKEGLVSLLEPWQRKYNEIMNMHSVHLDFATSGYAVVEDGSLDVDELSEDGLAPGKILVYRQGANLPHIEKDALKPEVYIESADYCYKQMIRTCEMFVNSQAVVIEDRFAVSGYKCDKK
jgi:hypothetical protein